MATRMNLGLEPWTGEPSSLREWLERFTLATEFNDVPAERWTHAMAACIGPHGYSTLKSIFGDQLTSTKFVEVRDELLKSVCPQKLVMLERMSFYRMRQEAGESAASFLARLQRQWRLAGFPKEADFLVRDQFLMGLHSDKAKAAIAEAGVAISATEALAKIHTLAEVESVRNAATVKSVTPATAKPAQPRQQPQKKPAKDTCSRCTLRGHSSTQCNVVCRHCGKVGHIAKHCRSRLQGKPAVNAAVMVTESRPDPVLVDVCMHRGSVDEIRTFEIDTGSEITVLPSESVKRFMSECVVAESEEMIEFTVANGEREQARVLWVDVCEPSEPRSPTPNPSVPSRSPSRKSGSPCTNTQSRYRLPLVVTENRKTPALMGRSWIKVLYPEVWESFNALPGRSSPTVNATTNDPHGRFREKVFGYPCFSEGVGTVEGVVSLDWKADATPKFHRARNLPFSLQPLVDTELDRLVAEGTWRPISSSSWASPLVPVRKADSTVRLCGDYKGGVNPALDCAVYPIPGLEECLEGLTVGLYTKLDVKQAYNSLVLSEEDQRRLCVNTHRGLFAPTRLPFGVSSAGGIWQRKMDEILGGLEGTKCRVDDILITAPTVAEHKERVLEVVQRLSDAGLKCRRDKCHVMVDHVDYLGYSLTPTGIVPMEERTAALSAMPPPENYQQLRSFIGAASYYRRFVPHFSEVIQPLLDLEKNDFKWEKQHERSFQLIKEKLSQPPSLVPYNQDSALILATDASSYALGAVLSQPGESGLHPVEFASRKLTGAETKYSMVEKEALAVVWAVKKFHRYLYGRVFEIHTDHRALQFVFSPEKSLPVMTVSRLARWAIILQSYTYTIRYEQVPQADVLSRLVGADRQGVNQIDSVTDCCDDKPVCICDEQLTCFFLGKSVKWKTSAADIAKETRKDPVLSKILALIREGAPAPQDRKDPDLKPYLLRLSQGQLTANLGCVMWGHRVCVPKTLWSRVVEQVHSSHPGIEYSKRIARGYVWFPGIDRKLEERCRQCRDCVEASPRPRYTVQPWPAARGPWERVHADLLQWKGANYIIVVDAFSNWVDAVHLSSTTSAAIIRMLSRSFQCWGLPGTFVSDNGPQLVSDETETWLEELGVAHPTSPPYNQRSNGLAECYVGKMKQAMRKGVTVEDWVLQHNATPIHSNDTTPAEKFMGRRLRTTLSAINPLFTAQPAVREFGDRAPRRSFTVGQPVYFRDGQQWVPDTVEEVVSTSVVSLRDAGRRHIDHVIDRTQVSEPVTHPDSPVSTPTLTPDSVASPSLTLIPAPVSDRVSTPSESDQIGQAPSLPRRSGRARREPDRFQPS